MDNELLYFLYFPPWGPSNAFLPFSSENKMKLIMKRFGGDVCKLVNEIYLAAAPERKVKNIIIKVIVLLWWKDKDYAMLLLLLFLLSAL